MAKRGQSKGDDGVRGFCDFKDPQAGFPIPIDLLRTLAFKTDIFLINVR